MSPQSAGKPDETTAIREYLKRIGRWQDEFGPFVDELVELRRLRADAVARVQERPVVKGSTGQDRENPAVQTLVGLQEQCNRLADALLLPPKAAARAGVGVDADPLDDLLGD